MLTKKSRLKIKVGNVFRRTLRAKTTAVINIGGARSGKSYAMAQLLIMKAVNESGCNIAVTRKTMPALKMTAYRLVLKLLAEYGFFTPASLNKTDNFYLLNKSRIQFFSLDDAEKIKSSEFNYIWMEEANEFSYNDYLVLLTRLSAPARQGGKNQIFLTLNPADANCWVAKNLLKQKDITVINSTYKDNNFLSGEYIKTLLSLKEHDENAYNVFALGLWGGGEKLVYNNWQSAEEPPQSYDDVIWGLDFGFNNPTALVKIFIKDSIFYAQERLYKTGLTNSALIEELQNIIPPQERGQTIYADSAEPARIAEIAARGFNIKPAQKALAAGIMAVKAAKPQITKCSENLLAEIQNYMWKSDLNGNILEEPQKMNDHALDALRYAIYTYGLEKTLSGAPDISFF